MSTQPADRPRGDVSADDLSRHDASMDRNPHAPRTFDPAGSEFRSSPKRHRAADSCSWSSRPRHPIAIGPSAPRSRSRRAGRNESAGFLLADLALVRPGLHDVVGVENGEGMTDAFLFGSSVLRVARPIRDRGFLFVPAGTATARPEAVATSPRWSAVVDCLRPHPRHHGGLPALGSSGREHLWASARPTCSC
jgi:hypothetical protein